MVLKHYPSGDARFGIRFLVNSNVYPVCQSLKNKLRVGVGQTVIAEYVPSFCFRLGWVSVASLMVRFLGVSCYSGQWIFGLSLFLSLALGFFVLVSLWGYGGAAWLLDFVFGVTLGNRSWGMGKLGLFVEGCSFWDLGSGALVISDCK